MFHLYCTAAIALTSFGAGEGPVLLSNVECNKNHSELFQCVHPEQIGLHNCDAENAIGVVCPNDSNVFTTTFSVITTKIVHTITHKDFTTSLSVIHTAENMHTVTYKDSDILLFTTTLTELEVVIIQIQIQEHELINHCSFFSLLNCIIIIIHIQISGKLNSYQ